MTYVLPIMSEIIPQSPWHGASSAYGQRGQGLQIMKVAMHTLNKHSGRFNNGLVLQLWGDGWGANNSPIYKKNSFLRYVTQGLRIGWTPSQTTQSEYDIWNTECYERLQSRFIENSSKRIGKKLKLDIVAGQETRRYEGGSQPVGNQAFFYGNENANHRLGTGFRISWKHISS